MAKNSKNIFDSILKKQNGLMQEEVKNEIDNKNKNDIGLLLDDFVIVNPEQTQKKQKIYYFLITSLSTNDSYKKLFEISQPAKSFSINQIKNANNEEQIIKNNIIKVKNFICSLLYNFDKLVEKNFNPDKVGSTEKILDELNTLMKSSYFVIDGTIPFDWYINSIYEYLKKIPDYLTKNDCEKLYEEIEQDINNSLEQLDFIKLSVILEKLEFAERGKIFYKENQKLLMDIKLKEQIKEIVYEEFIPVSIKFSWNEKDNGILEIEKANFKFKDKDNQEKIINYQKSKKVTLALTIDDFTKKFPNLTIYQEYQDADIFMIQEKLNFPEKLKNYFDLIYEHVKLYCKEIKNEYKDNMKQVEEIIFDFVMNKIYDKIFPIELSGKDTLLYQNTIRLSWVKPCHFLGDKKQYVLGSFINDINFYFKQIISEKSTRKKLSNLDQIINNISFFYKFNDKKDIGLDDILPVLTFAMIKAHPSFLDSNIKYMKLYSKLGEFFKEGSKFEQFEAAMELIIQIKYSDLKGITKEEFIENVNNEKKS